MGALWAPLLGASYPPCNHVGVQLRSEGGVPIGNDSAAKNMTLWAKSKGGPEGPTGGEGGARRATRKAPRRIFPTQSDLWMQGPLSPVRATCKKK